MNLRWLWGNFTDPLYNISRRDQFLLSKVANAKYLDRDALAVRSLTILAPIILALVVLKPALQWLGYAGARPMFMGLVMVVVATWPWSAWMYRSLYVRPIRRAMRDEGWDLCIECGYELRRLDDSITRCPECGATCEPTTPSPVE